MFFCNAVDILCLLMPCCFPPASFLLPFCSAVVFLAGFVVPLVPVVVVMLFVLVVLVVPLVPVVVVVFVVLFVLVVPLVLVVVVVQFWSILFAKWSAENKLAL